MVPDGYARMAKEGLLGPDHNLVHGTSYDTADLESSSTTARRSPRPCWSSCIIISATPWSRRIREAGGLPSIGIDVEPFCSGQMFREMQAALLFARGKEVRNNALRGNSPFKTIPVRSREALEWATIGGARAFLMEDRIGTLTPGKKADIVMLRANDINMAPV